MAPFPSPILAATDGSEDSRLAVRAAADLARRSQSALHLVHALEARQAGDRLVHTRSTAAQEILDDARSMVESLGSKVTREHTPAGHPTDVVLALSEEIDAGLIVMGTRGHGPIARLLLGSVAHGVLQHATRPVLVMRGSQGVWPPRRIVVGDDASDESGRACDAAAAIATLCDAPVIVVHAMPELDTVLAHTLAAGPHVCEDILAFARATLDDRVRRLRDGNPIHATPRLEFDEPALSLLEVAGEEHLPTLIVVGSRGLGPWQRLRFGSVSTKVLHAAHCPVLVTPHLPAQAPL